MTRASWVGVALTTGFLVLAFCAIACAGALGVVLVLGGRS